MAAVKRVLYGLFGIALGALILFSGILVISHPNSPVRIARAGMPVSLGPVGTVLFGLLGTSLGLLSIAAGIVVAFSRDSK